ncbi:MAG: four helix bundle protein [Bacteroidales bacterium]|nr:four helix bundle protein [Bacteroidales bacterium]MBN2772631.1 four helix bundle protein [Prolixibacteraceae bacterium]
MKVEDLIVYQMALEIGDEIYKIVDKWESFEKWTTGKQLLEAADSIAANISEGYGRYFYKENRQFQYYSRGSQSETKTWLTKANNRNLISSEIYNELMQKLEILAIKHNAYINSIGSKPIDK